MKCRRLFLYVSALLVVASSSAFGQTLREALEIPSDGSTVNTATVLENRWLFDVVVSGLYRYDVGEPGEFADAQYREDDNDQYAIRFNSVEFDGVRRDADVFDLANHTYTYHWVGTGDPLPFRIYDGPGTYGDNEGSLHADIYFNAVPEPSVLGLLAMGSVSLLICVSRWRERAARLRT